MSNEKERGVTKKRLRRIRRKIILLFVSLKRKLKPKYKIGEMVVIKHDPYTKRNCLFHIHDITKQQGIWLYGGYILEMKKNEEFGIMVPAFCTTCIFVQESGMFELNDLRIKFKPWNK